jgi:hypothetical protein
LLHDGVVEVFQVRVAFSRDFRSHCVGDGH